LRVLVCPTAFKESLSSRQAAEAVAEGVRSALPEASILVIPVSDGGPGLIESLSAALGGGLRRHQVHGPLGEPVEARSLWLSEAEAVVESADACGLHLVPATARDPMSADTLGVGELVAECVGQGAVHIAVGLGGSATVDGGTGMARHFGYRFRDADGSDLPRGGGELCRLARIERGDAFPAGIRVTGIADVRGPLTGPDGAARRFAPQKGAGPEEVRILEAGLTRLGARLREDLDRDVEALAGAGAAGGLGAACAAFLGGALVPGSDWVLERVRFDEALADADLVITGEGAWDSTSGMGKVAGEILRRAGAAQVRALLVCGLTKGPTPPGVTVIGGGGAWLEPKDVTRLVAEALG